MLERFGAERVIDAPIAENGFAGIGIGAAMVGLRPIIEFMTWTFSAVAFDQILSNAAKIRQCPAGSSPCPSCFAAPTVGGPGRRAALARDGALLRSHARASRSSLLPCRPTPRAC